MQKIILDTNVIISALIQKSYPHLILYHYFLENKVKTCLSEELLQEYYDVINRPKFSKYPHFLTKAELLLIELEKKSDWFHPIHKVDLLIDKDDNKILELAETSQASFIITGNTNHFTFDQHKTTRIVSPKDYWDIYAPR